MKITKFGHACLVLEDAGHKLIIDPGSFSELPADLKSVGTVVVTEEHYDHFSVDNLKSILAQSPNAVIYSTAAVVDALAKEDIKATTISGQQTIESDGFTINFYETDHAPVYQISPCRSLSVKVNDDLYYPSDSYQTIPDHVKLLALPTSGPWFKVEECIDFLNYIKSDKIMPTHNGLNSGDGNNVTHHFLETHVADKSRKFVYLEPGDTVEIYLAFINVFTMLNA